MKNKQIFSESTPPRHKGLFARFRSLRFMLVMLMAMAFGTVYGEEVLMYVSGSSSTSTLNTGDEIDQSFSSSSSYCSLSGASVARRTGSIGSVTLTLNNTDNVVDLAIGGKSSGSSARSITAVSLNGTDVTSDVTISGSTATCGELLIEGINASKGDAITITFSGNFQISYFVATTGSGSSCSATAPGDISKGAKGNPLTLTAAGSPASGDAWYWQTAADGTSTTNAGATFDVTAAGTYYVRSYNAGADCWSSAKSIVVTESDLVAVNCPEKGERFKVVFNAVKDYSLNTTKTAEEEITSSYATVTNGKVFAGTNKNSDQTVSIKNQSSSMQFLWGSSNTYLKLELDCPLANGDVISFESTTNYELSFTLNTNRTTTYATSSKTYTVTEGDGLKGQEVIYLWRYSGSSTYVHSITIRRPVFHAINYAEVKDADMSAYPTQYEEGVGVASFAPLANVDGWDFVAWSPASISAEATTDQTITATWTAAATKYTVTYKDGETTLDTEDVEEGQKAANVPTPTKLFNSFAGWEDAEHNPVDFETATITADLTVFAKWTPWSNASSIDIEKYVVDNGSATLDDAKAQLASANVFTTNLAAVDRDHTHNNIYDGIKWSNANNGDLAFIAEAGKLVVVRMGYLKSNTAAKMFVNGVADATVIASANESVEKYHDYYWYNDAAATYQLKINSKDANGTCVFKALSIVDPFVVNFANGGEIDPMTFKGTALVLPAATGVGEFQGWYDAETAGNKVGDEGDAYTPAGDITLYAQFSAQSSDNSLKTLKYGETPIEIVADQLVYNVNLPYKSIVPASVTYEANSLVATPAGEQTATVTDGTATFTITAENGATADYTVTFTVAPKDGISIIKATHTGATTASVEGLIGGSVDKNTQDGGKLGSNGHFFGIKLAEGTFLAGDVLTISASNPSATVQIFSDKGTNMLNEGVFVDNVYTFTLEDATEWIYLYRTSSAMNPTLGYMEVKRAMNPVLTALTVAGKTATIDEANKTISVKLDNGTDAATAELVPTIIANGGEPTAALDGTLAYDTPINYVVTDKDGDQTTYVLTATEAATPAAEPVITVQPASRDYLDTEVIAALTVEATVSDAGVLSYQWYKGEEPVGENLSTYTPTEAGSYKVVVTNTLGEETATATSEVAVITVRHIYTFAAWDGTSVNFTKADEWTMYSSANSGKELAENQETPATTFKADQQVDYANVNKANVNYTQYVTVVFAKDMKAVQLQAYNSSSRSLNNIYTLDVEGKKLTDVTSKYTRNSAQNSTTKVSTMDATGLFEADVYYVFKLSSACNVFDFFATAAPEKSADPAVATLVAETVCSDGTFATLNAVTADESTYSYQWYKDDAEFATTQTINPTDGGVYYCKVTNSETDKRAVTKETNKVTLVRLTSGTTVSVEDGLAKTGETVELTATAAGAGTLAYAWYTCDDAEGTNPVVIPDEEGATYTATVGTETAYYMVVVTADCGTASAVATVNVKPETYELQDVTGAMTFNFVGAVDAQVSGLNNGTYEVLANYDGIKAQANGQYVAADFSKITTGNLQGKGLKFHTTTPLFITIVFSNTGTSTRPDRELYVNGVATGAKSKNTTKVTYTQFVEAGDVVLTAFEEGKTWNMLNFYKIEFKAASEVRTGLTVGRMYTTCQAQAIYAVDGAEFYEPVSWDGFYLDFVEAEEIKAGYGYMFIATATELNVAFTGEAVSAAEVGAPNGMQGTLELVNLPYDEANPYNLCGITNNHLQYIGANNSMGANRAYVVLDKVGVEPPTAAPSARRVRLTTEGSEVVTGIEFTEESNIVARKVVVDGQVYILRAGNLYTVQGQLVK